MYHKEAAAATPSLVETTIHKSSHGTTATSTQQQQQQQQRVYVSSVVDVVSECWRLFLSPDRLWGCQKYSEYMIGHQLVNHRQSSSSSSSQNNSGDENDDRVLVLEDIKNVPSNFINQIREAARPLGFVVVDVGLTSTGQWCVVECNPPFALSSYDLDIGIYVEYCVAAWKHLLLANGEN